jgi:beta-mannosidase
VYLVAVPAGSTAILHAVSTTRFVSGSGTTWPVRPLPDDGSSRFTVNTTIYTWSQAAVTGTLTVTGEWGGSATARCTLPAGDGACMVPQLQASAVKLWWPRGLGPQQMYNVTASFAPSSSSSSSSSSGAPAATSAAATALSAVATRRIGFRLAALVTINDTSAEAVKRAATTEGTGNHTLMLRINGAAVAARGANMIPMELMEGRIVPGMHTNLVASAAAANFNTIRVCGGGIYPLDEWLDACDEYGVMGIIDMQYSTDGIFPGASDTPTQEAELRHQVRRMAHHPSVVWWSGCNECGGIGALADVIAEEDQSRSIRAASPSIGYQAGVHTLDDHPSGTGLRQRHHGPPSTHGLPWHIGESHGPYNFASLWPAVNGGGQGKAVTLGVNGSESPLPKIQPGYETGPSQPGYFVSESGATVMSSFESMSATLSKENWGVHSAPFYERNYPW